MKIDEAAIEAMKELLDKKEPLHPELVPYLENDGIPMLRHPLIYSLFHTEFQNARTNQLYEWKKKAIVEARQEKKWNTFIFLHERPYRLQAFLEIRSELKCNDFWKTLGEVWIDSENIHQNLEIWKTLLDTNKKGRKFFMDEEDREKFAALPNELTIYRGCEPRNKNGLSYTLDEKKALWFSKRLNKRGDGLVIVKEIKKSDVFAYLDGRNEKEIILKPKWRLE